MNKKWTFLLVFRIFYKKKSYAWALDLFLLCLYFFSFLKSFEVISHMCRIRFFLQITATVRVCFSSSSHGIYLCWMIEYFFFWSLTNRNQMNQGIWKLTKWKVIGSQLNFRDKIKSLSIIVDSIWPKLS